jgi:DNA processing protein
MLPSRALALEPGAMNALRMTHAELAAWLALAHMRGVGPSAVRALVDAFGEPRAVLAQSFQSLAAFVGERLAAVVLAPPAPELETTVAQVAHWCAQPGHALISLIDPAYPAALLTMHDPPPLLYIKGRAELLLTPGIAVVGSRNATPQGLEDAKRFARALSQAGLTVISGLALGIDGAAHRGALDAAGGTVAIVGTGADVVYPMRHRELAQQIAARGAIVSEWPLGTPARREHFPRRNRMIAGLARGVLVVEAAVRSGSLITARLANEMGRDVFAMPGSIHSPLSRGCHQLIKDGAKLTETPDDIFDEFGIAAPASAAQTGIADGQEAPQAELRPRATEQRRFDVATTRLLDALGHAPATLEILVERTDMESAALQSALLTLELAGEVSALPGGRYMRVVLNQETDRAAPR